MKGKDKQLFLGKPLMDLRDRLHDLNGNKIFNLTLETEFLPYNSSGSYAFMYEDAEHEISTESFNAVDEAAIDLMKKVAEAYGK